MASRSVLKLANVFALVLIILITLIDIVRESAAAVRNKKENEVTMVQTKNLKKSGVMSDLQLDEKLESLSEKKDHPFEPKSGLSLGVSIEHAMKFEYRNEEHTGAWGMDYIVDEQYRNQSAGMLLAKKALKQRNHFGVGLSDVSLKIHLAFKERVIGHLKKYIFLNVSQLPFLLRSPSGKKQPEYPDRLHNANSSFSRISPSFYKPSVKSWNDHVLEFNRDPAFFRWRFDDAICDYAIYVKEGPQTGNDYFVVRRGIWRKLNMLILVDYRYRTDHPQSIATMLDAIKQLTRTAKFDGILTCSSLSAMDKALTKKGFYHFGRSREIVTNFKIPSLTAEAIQSRDFIFLTMADSDTDFNFTNSSDVDFSNINQAITA